MHDELKILLSAKRRLETCSLSFVKKTREVLEQLVCCVISSFALGEKKVQCRFRNVKEFYERWISVEITLFYEQRKILLICIFESQSTKTWQERSFSGAANHYLQFSDKHKFFACPICRAPFPIFFFSSAILW